MIEYPKIETLFDRDPVTRLVMPGAVRCPEFNIISEWHCTEKVDGTNIRVHLSEENVMMVGGRTESAQVPAKLVNRLHERFNVARLAGLRKDEEAVSICLFGEGYGAGIQKGGIYSETQDFVLFDVLIADKWWLRRTAVCEIAEKLGLPVVPDLGVFTSLDAIVDLVRSAPTTALGLQAGRAEGIVARTEPPLFDNQHQRIMFKLKTKDFGRTP